jgi:predicted  nucleic acid-binding Zn-ribbon protein
MNRRLEVELLLKLYGSESKFWRGGKLIATCPFAPYRHSSGRDSHPSFAVMENNGYYSYKCLSCGEGGPLPRIIWRMAELGAAYVPQASWLAYNDEHEEREKIPVSKIDYAVGGSFSAFGPSLRATPEQISLGIGAGHPSAVKYGPPDNDLMERWIAAPVPDYVVERGFADVHAAWRLGHNEKERRWVHPIRNVKGELVGYTARLYWDKPHCYRCGEMLADEHGKMLHECPKCRTSYVKYKHHSGPWRRDNLFGIERHIKGEPIVITEGSTDVLNLWRHGVRHPVAILGASMSHGQMQLIAQATDRVFVMGDGDHAGRHMNEEVVSEMDRKFGIKVCVISCPDGMDGGSLSAEQVADLFPLDAIDSGASSVLPLAV